MSLAEISRKTGIATSTVFDYFNQLEKHVVLKHACLPDFKKLGFPLRKKFLVRTKDRKAALTWLKEHSAVNNLYRVDAYDAFVDALFPDVNALEDFKEELKRTLKPKELKEFDILEELKHEAFIPSSKDT